MVRMVNDMDIPEWLNDLPDDLKNDKSLHKFPDKEKLAKSYIELEKKIGGMVSLPRDETDEEGYNKILARLGRPDDVKGYEHPEGLDEDTKTLLSDIALKSGLTKRQYQSFAKMLMDRQRAVVQEGLEKTKQELGEEFSKVDEALEKMSPKIKQALYKSGLVADTAFMKEFTTIVNQFREDKPVDSAPKPKQKDHPYAWMYERFPKE